MRRPAVVALVSVLVVVVGLELVDRTLAVIVGTVLGTVAAAVWVRHRS